MQANPHCLTKLDACLFRAHYSIHTQCDNTRRMRSLLRSIFADGRLDESDRPELTEIRALVDDEYNRNLETDRQDIALSREICAGAVARAVGK